MQSMPPGAANTLTLNFTNDAYYEKMLRLNPGLFCKQKDTGTWTITNPKTNPLLAPGQINDLIVIAHYEVSLV
jgi:hypothetical protein